jgi:cyclophilin family peptidyl-prolyl cis-trans isomerase
MKKSHLRKKRSTGRSHHEQPRSQHARRPHFEKLEDRCLLSTVGFNPLSNVTLAAGTTMFIPLNSVDAGQTVNYAVTASDYSKLTPTITPSTNKTLQLNVVVGGVTQPMDFQLFDNLAPNTTAKIEQLVQAGYYNGLQIYRNAKDGSNPFVLQGGNDPPTGAIKADQPSIPEEFNPNLQYTTAGILGMARTSTPGTGSTEFFVMEEPCRYLDFNYTIFGFQTVGTGVVQTISAMPDQGDPSIGYLTTPVTINSASIFTDTQNGLLEVRARPGITGTVTVTVTASDGTNTPTTRSFTVTIQADAPSNPVNPFASVIPATPSSVALMPAAGGSSQSTNVDQSGINNTLQFQVSGVTSGNLVEVLADGNVIGQTTATGTTVTVPTDGSAELADGSHIFTALQIAQNQTVSVTEMGSSTPLTTTADVPSLNVVAAMPLNLVVTTTVDKLAPTYDPANLSLREAVALANANPGADTISFAASLDGGTINLSLGELAITDSLTIDGPGATNLTINANNQSRIFQIDDGSNTTNINVEIDGLTLTGGNASGTQENGAGGAIFTFDSLTVKNSTITGNTGATRGGGIYSWGYAGGTTTIQNSTIANNTAAYGGGIWTETAPASTSPVLPASALTIQDSTVSGNTATTTRSNGGGGIYNYTNQGTVLIQGSTISGNTSEHQAGPTITRTSGGGILIWKNFGTVTVDGDTISGNTGGTGGGIMVRNSYGGTTTIENSTISGNNGDEGAGVFLRSTAGTISVQNSTISGNHASDKGGGVYTQNYQSIGIQNSTITGNTAQSAGGGLYVKPPIAAYYQYDWVNVDSTIIAANTDTSGTAPDVFATYTDPGTGIVYNTANFANSLVGNNTNADLPAAPLGTPDANGNLVGTSSAPIDPELGPLANNGGPTQTCALLKGSPAIDMGSNPASLTTDQRGAGFLREWGGTTDIGAYEYQTAPAVTNVLVGSTAWTGDFLSSLAGQNSRNVGGYSIPVGSGSQLVTLPWANIDQIKVVFSENVVVDQADLLLSGVNTPSYNISGGAFSYDPLTFTATWTLPQAIGSDKLMLALNADGTNPIEDSAGDRLDGEWTNPASTADTSGSAYPSGNGAAGGDFHFRLNVLPADATQDGVVSFSDLSKLLAHYGIKSGATWSQGDFTGDGAVNFTDLSKLLAYYGKSLPPGEPVAGSFPAAVPLIPLMAAPVPKAVSSEPATGGSGLAVDTLPTITADSGAMDGRTEAVTPAVVLLETACTQPLVVTVDTVASAPRDGFPTAVASVPTPPSTGTVNSSLERVSATADQAARFLTLPAFPATNGWLRTAAVAMVERPIKARDRGVANRSQGETLLPETWGDSFFTGKTSTITGPTIRADLVSFLAPWSRVHDVVLEEELSDSSPREWAWIADVAHALAGRADDLDSFTNVLDDVLVTYQHA